ncbi:MAG: two component, sigma54 specific, transcriptional regulator, Fis family [Candidatus Midichloriaceae bacterium]|jgi:two-component system nitrogen regulation response regulator NtrX|nr:two component, sigma54 specific, transcriptional regulator, Fis family [Candidatus Midichloriaceae bacterium]
MPKILVVDDEVDIRDLVSDILNDEGYSTVRAGSAARAIEAITLESFQAVILDIWLEGSELDGIGVLKAIKNLYPDLPVIMISGHGNIETAVQTIKLGAYDFIEKPFKAEKLTLMVERAVNNYNLILENNLLKRGSDDSLFELKWSSRTLQSVVKCAKSAAGSNSRITITGEDGAGKESLARYIHKNSPRSSKAFIVLNALSIDDENFEAQLFGKGHEIGLLQRCRGGTLYIDEVTDLSPKVQSRFLSVLQDAKLDVRVVAASSKDLGKAVNDGILNSSLYYRLNVLPLHIPPLREYTEDIGTLMEKFLNTFELQNGVESVSISPEAISALQLYNWPGNIRQLKNVAEWLVIMKSRDKKCIEVSDLPAEIKSSNFIIGENNWVASAFSKPLKEARDNFEREYLKSQLARYGGNISKTAVHVGMDRTALHRKIKALDG